MKKSLFVLLLCAPLLWSTHAAAEANTHDGFHFQLQGGLGYFSTTAEDAFGELAISGMTVPMNMLLGGSVMPGLAIGASFMMDYSPSPSWEYAGNDTTPAGLSHYIVGLGLYGDYYLDPSGGVHIQGMVGWGGLESSSDASGAGGSDPTGLVAYLGGGYDVFFSEEWSVGGLARLTYAPIALNDVDYPTISPAVAVTLTYH